MIGLGIESTAHTFGVGLITGEFNVLANVKKTYNPKKGGIHPREAAQHHLQVAATAIREALMESNVGLKDLDFISFSQGPGLICRCLKVLA